MPPLINAQGLSKRYGIAPLFRNISFTVSEDDRIGLIGPNGSGKSTLLGILNGEVRPDDGDVALRKGTRLTLVRQISEFAPDSTCRSVIEEALGRASVAEFDRRHRAEAALSRAGFTDFDAAARSLSGGWRKRLAIAEGMAQEPAILLLDEPTNHLDLAGIEWLESLLRGASFACVVVSHDRTFLENVANDVMELDRAYEDGFLRVRGNYSRFLEAKEEYLHAQGKRQEALANRVRTEIEWLRRGPKARTTKSKARIEKAHEMIGELAEVNARTGSASAGIDFSSSQRQTKQLIELAGVSYSIDGRALFSGLDFKVQAGMRVGLVGPNGSGKSTLLRLLRGDVEPSAGHVRRAEKLRVVYFDQARELDPELMLRRALAPDSDSVIYRDRVIHVAAWAARFLFENDQLNRPVGRLSGGERARVLIAQLMLQPADVLLLDEPTNDLDIPTLEILEESLVDYPGALVLVTHDRFMLNRVSTVVLGLDGQGSAGRFADYSQWEEWMESQALRRKKEGGAAEASARKATSHDKRSRIAAAKHPATIAASSTNHGLTRSESRELAGIEKRIAAAEAVLHERRAALEDPEIARDASRLQPAYSQMQAAQDVLDELYARWAELEEKRG